MTDRELLAYAAKAAGIQFSEAGGGARYAPQPGIMQPYVPWNPLTDDGDALRLAVKLKFVLSPPDPYLNKVYVSGEGVGCVEDCLDEPYAATRRAIVRAAAEIGRSKE